MSAAGSDWSPALVAAIGHLPDGAFDSLQMAAIGWMVRELAPLGEDTPAAGAEPELLDVAIATVLQVALPETMRPFAGIVADALRVGASALWRSLQADALRVEADGSRIEVSVEP